MKFNERMYKVINISNAADRWHLFGSNTNSNLEANTLRLLTRYLSFPIIKAVMLYILFNEMKYIGKDISIEVNILSRKDKAN